MRLFAVLALALGAISATFAQPKEIIGANPNSQAPLSPAVKAGGFIYASGTAGVAGGKGDIKGQTKVALDNLAARLKLAGSSMANACLVSVYLRNFSDYAGMNEVYATYFPKDPPARVTVIVDGTPAADGLFEISIIAVPDGAERRVIKPKGWSDSPLPYSYGIQSGNTLFLAGLVSRNGVDNTNVKGDITAQTNYIMGNAGAILKEAGMSLADVVQSRVYITDTANFQAMNAAYRSAFPAAPPARATVRTGLTNADYLIEIGMIAVKDASRTAISTPGPDGKPGAANPNLSAAIRVGNRLFVSGITGNTADNKGDAAAQTTEALARIARTLKAAGFEMSDVVEGMAYVVDRTKFPEVNAAYRTAFQKDFPARTGVSVGLVGAGAEAEFSFIAQK
ncbi:MAG TPA: RidA family protein [Bryobacteraceae bacterium]|nr:RidA family protein [Bryobacteraceae bacterium]